MNKIKVEDSVGMVLAHDITRIIPGEFKGVAFKKGHLIAEKDIPELLKIGKEHIYIMELSVNQLHEDDAALRIAPAVSDENLTWTNPKEGKSAIKSSCRGLLNVNAQGLKQINQIGDLIVSTLKTNTPVSPGQTIASTRIIPLVIDQWKIEQVELMSSQFYPILSVKPFYSMKFGGVVTGSEIYKGLIKDEFDEYVAEKTKSYGCQYLKKVIVPDDPQKIASAIHELKEAGCELILTTGGMSVDPDDVTKLGIQYSGAEVLSYGTPVLPGAMFLYANLDDTIILGLPACVFYHKATVYDLILIRVLAGEKITADTVADMAHGGLCLNCSHCQYPVCPFGK